MRKITIPTKASRGEPPQPTDTAEAAPRPRLALKYGANAEARSRP